MKHSKILLGAIIIICLLISVFLLTKIWQVRQQTITLDDMAKQLEERRSSLISSIELQEKINAYKNTTEGKLKIARDLGYQQSGEDVYDYRAIVVDSDILEEEIIVTKDAKQEWFDLFFK